MPLTRTATVVALIVAALTLQVGLFPQLSIAGVVPDLVMLVVIGLAFVWGPRHGAQIGLLAGLLVDLAPPADHTAGRWALAFVIVGYLAGLVRHDAEESAVAAVIAVAGCTFVGASVFALSGLVLSDPGVTVSRVLTIVPIAVLYNVIVTPVVIPAVMAVLNRLDRPMTLRSAVR